MFDAAGKKHEEAKAKTAKREREQLKVQTAQGWGQNCSKMGFTPGLAVEQIDRLYKQLQREYHPDKNGEEMKDLFTKFSQDITNCKDTLLKTMRNLGGKGKGKGKGNASRQRKEKVLAEGVDKVSVKRVEVVRERKDDGKWLENSISMGGGASSTKGVSSTYLTGGTTTLWLTLGSTSVQIFLIAMTSTTYVKVFQSIQISVHVRQKKCFV